MENNFDPVLYTIGDRVIAKNKSPDINDNIPKMEIVVNTEDAIEFSEGRFCQILYFESNPTSFELAINYEPYDEQEKVDYYRILKEKGFSTTKSRTKTTKVKPTTKRQENIKNFLKNN